MVLDEGRNREMRRLLARLGHKVQRLTRVAVGPIRLGELPRGAVRMLTHEEVKKLREAAAAGPEARSGRLGASATPGAPRSRRTEASSDARQAPCGGSGQASSAVASRPAAAPRWASRQRSRDRRSGAPSQSAV